MEKFLRGIIYWFVCNLGGGVNENHPIRRGRTKFVLNLAEEINDITLALEGIQVSLNSLFRVIMIDIIALDFLCAGHGKVCAIANTSFCA